MYAAWPGQVFNPSWLLPHGSVGGPAVVGGDLVGGFRDVGVVHMDDAFVCVHMDDAFVCAVD